MPKVKISIKGIPNDGGVMDIDFFKIDKECDVFVVNEGDLPYVLLKRKIKRMKLKKRDRERIFQNIINRDMENTVQETEKEADNEEEESEEENNSEDSDQEDEEEEEESEEDAKKKKSNETKKKEEKKTKEKKTKEETKEEKYEKMRQEKERKENEKQQLALSKQKGVLSLIKSKVDDSKNASKISQSLNLDNDEGPEETKMSNLSENIKKKEQDELQKLKNEQANLFKESLNKTKPYYKDMEKFEVIAEVNSNDELSTVRQSIKGGKVLEAIEDDKTNLDNLAVSKNSKSAQKKDIKATEVVPSIPQESNHEISQKSKSDVEKRSSQTKVKQELKAKITEDEELSGIIEEDLKLEDKEENVSAEGEESEKEEQSESEPSDQEIEYEKPVFPSKRHAKYFEKIKNKKGYEDKVLLVNLQFRGDYEFFLRKLYYLYTLKPKLLIISFDENEKHINQYLLNKLSESNDVRVLLVKQSEKQKLIEAMTVNIGKKKIRKRVFEGIQITSKIIKNSLIYSWGCASNGKLGLGKLQNLENLSDFQVACPIHFNREFNELANSNTLGKKALNLDNNYRKYLFTYVPQVILSIWGQEFKSIKCGLNHSVALTESSDKIYVWGDNSYSQQGFPIIDKHNNFEISISQTPSSMNSPRDKFSTAVAQSAKIINTDGSSKSQFISTPKLHPKFNNTEDANISNIIKKVSIF